MKLLLFALLVAACPLGCKDAPSTPATGSGDPKPVPAGDGMIGAAPATLGSAFAGIAWDKQPRHADAKRIGNQLGVELELEPGPAQLRAIEIKKTQGCQALRDRLAHAWGAATNEAWHDPKAHLRASYWGNTDSDECGLRFERYVDLEPWLAQIPTDAIGSTPDKVAAKLGPEAIVGERGVKWERPALGYATVATDLEATLGDDENTIYEVTATTQTDVASTQALVALLTKRAGAPPRIETDTETRTTKRHWDAATPRLALFVTSDYIRPGTDFLTLFVMKP